MSNSHHDDHHSSGPKPVAFTMPLILASVLILVIGLFLSLCDPKHEHAGDAGHEEHAAAKEATHQDAATHEDHAAVSTEPAAQKDSENSENTAPAAEQAPAHH